MKNPMRLETTGASSSRLAVLAVILVSYLMIVLDISIVITGLPRIRQSLGFSATGLSWVHNTYTLAFGGFLLLGARAGDILGRRRMFMSGVALFTFASLVIGLAPSPAWLLAARAVQGLGAAIIAPSTLALLTTNFAPGAERTRALSYYAAVAGIGTSLGLVLGGIFADQLSWRFGFFINVPLGLALLIGAMRSLRETERRAGEFDVGGAFGSTLGMASLVYGLVRAAEDGWRDPVTIAALVAATMLIAFLVVNESRAKQPIMPLRLFTSRSRVGAYAARILFLGAMVGFWFFTTQFLQGVLGFSALKAGLAFLPTTVSNFIAALAIPKLTKRFGNARLLAGGLAISVIGMAWLSQATADGSYVWSIALPMILIGAAQGSCLPPLTVVGVEGVSPEDAGAASGVVNAAHQLGGSLGLAVLVIVFAAASSAADSRVELAHRIGNSMAAGTVMLTLALALVVVLIVQPKRCSRPTRRQPLMTTAPSME